MTVRRIREIYGNLRRSARALALSVPVNTQGLRLSIKFGELAGLFLEREGAALPFVGQLSLSMSIDGLK